MSCFYNIIILSCLRRLLGQAYMRVEVMYSGEGVLDAWRIG